jgi:Flp pilus assembly protein CpaB
VTRGRRRALGWAAVALLLAGLALTRGGGRQSPQARLASVVVAVRAIPAGRPIAAADLRVRQVPAAAVSVHQIASPSAAVGRVAAVALAAGSPLMDAELASPAGPASRDVAVRLDDLAGVPAEATQGVRADLYLTRAGRRPVIQRVLSGVLVVAASRSSDGAVATLRLAPDQVQTAIAAEGLGQLRLVVVQAGRT